MQVQSIQTRNIRRHQSRGVWIVSQTILDNAQAILTRFIFTAVRLRGRVERMEGAIGSIVSKIDMVLIKLESMEKSKSKRKANMSKIMEGFMENDGNEE